MRLLAPAFYSQSSPRGFYVVRVRLDDGDLWLADRAGQVGALTLTPAILELGAISDTQGELRLNSAKLPVLSGYWVNRVVEIYLVVTDDITPRLGARVFIGTIEEEPTQTQGVLTVNLGPSRLAPVQIPPLPALDTILYPSAPIEAVGQYKPVIYGTVEECVFTPVVRPRLTTLRRTAAVGENYLTVADATVFGSAGTVVVDGQSYTYTARDDRTLYGVSVVVEHQAGTAVHEPGTTVYLGAGHAVSTITALRDDTVAVTPASTSLASCKVIFTGAGTRAEEGQLFNITIEADSVDASNTALNSINAIRAATGSTTQAALTLPASVSNNAAGYITFARPLPIGGTDRIIVGGYSVAFVVSTAVGLPAVGRAQVLIGEQIVWAWEAGQVIYNNNPAVISYDRNSDQLPVRVVLDNAPVSSFFVTITAASRTVALGNLDGANFATLRKASSTTFAVKQTTANPNRGRIKRAQLVVEHFSAASTVDEVTVYWASTVLGKLSAANQARSSETRTIHIDTISPGSAQVANTTVTHALTGSLSRTDTSLSLPFNVPIAYTVRRVAGTPTQTYVYALDAQIALPNNVVAGGYQITVWQQMPSASIVNTTEAKLGGVAFTPNGSSQVVSVTISAAQQYLRLEHDLTLSPPTGQLSTYQHPTIRMLTGAISYTPTVSAIVVSAGAVTGTTQLANSSVVLAAPLASVRVDGTGTDTLTFTYPTSPRTVINTFDIPTVQSWDDLTDKIITLVYTGAGTADVGVVRCYLAVDYTPLVHIPIERLNATITGLSGNPAAVLQDLLTRKGEVVDSVSYNALQAWAQANTYTLARRVAEPQDINQVLREVSEQSLVQLAPTSNGMALRRRLEAAQPTHTINEDDLLSPLLLGYVRQKDICNDLTLAYAFLDDKPSKLLRRYSGTPDAIAAASLAALTETRAKTLNGYWIADDATAQRFVADYLRLYAPLRRLVTLELPPRYAGIEVGDRIWLANMRLTARVITLQHDNAWLRLQAEEIPAAE